MDCWGGGLTHLTSTRLCEADCWLSSCRCCACCERVLWWQWPNIGTKAPPPQWPEWPRGIRTCPGPSIRVATTNKTHDRRYQPRGNWFVGRWVSGLKLELFSTKKKSDQCTAAVSAISICHHRLETKNIPYSDWDRQRSQSVWVWQEKGRKWRFSSGGQNYAW